MHLRLNEIIFNEKNAFLRYTNENISNLPTLIFILLVCLSFRYSIRLHKL